MTSWNELLRQARDAQGLSRRALAERAGVSADTIANYEYARSGRAPETLRRLARALNFSAAQTDALLANAGFPSEGIPPELQPLWRRRPVPTSLAETVQGYLWPCLVLNERFEVTNWNEAAVRVAEQDFATASPSSRARNMMRLAADYHFRQRADNWTEIVSHLMGLMKGNLPGLARAGDVDAYFAAVVGDIARDFPRSLPELMQLWTTTPPLGERRNLYFPRWTPGDGTTLHFNTLVTTWSDFDALYANDWHPADATTWEWLAERTPAEADLAAAQQAAPEFGEPTTPWFRLLRQARDASSLTRPQLAARAGISTRALDNYETAVRKPHRPMLLHLTRAMALDGASTNAILTAAGEEPEPSDWALFLSGFSPRTVPDHFGAPPATPWSLADVRSEIAPYPWPCLLVDAGCDIAGGNEPAARVLGLDVQQGVRDPRRRNLVRFALSQAFRERVVNWEEVVTVIVPSTLRQALSSEPVSGVLQSLVAGLERDEPGVLAQLRTL